MKGEDLRRDIEAEHEKLRRLQVRAALASYEPWMKMAQSYEAMILEIEDELLTPPNEETAPSDAALRRIRLLQGRRQVMVGLLFEVREVDEAMAKAQQRLQGLQQQLQQWEAIQRHGPP